MRYRIRYSLMIAAALAAMLAACSETAATAPGVSAGAHALSAALQTRASASGEVAGAVLVADAADPAASRIVGAAGMGGLEIYALDGRRVGSAPAGEAVSIDVAHDVPLAGGPATVVAVVDTMSIDGRGQRLRLYRLDGDALTEVGAGDFALDFAAEGVCLMRGRRDRALYAFVVGDGGEIDQHLLFGTADGKVDTRHVRRVHVPSSLKQCVADPVAGTVYASEEAVGIWRFNADPEAELEAVLVDAARMSGLEEVAGLAIHDGGPGARWLLASDEAQGRINLYDIERDETLIGSFTVAPQGGGAIEEPGQLSVTSAALGDGFPNGVLLVGDENGPDFKLVPLDAVAAAFGLAAGVPRNPRAVPESDVPVVTSVVETVPMPSFGDAADDPAIWAHPTAPEKSVVIGTDKKAGLYVYDTQGKVLQFLPDGRMNNVDLREGFKLGGEEVVLVTASNRTDKSIAIYRLDTAARRLIDVADGEQTTGMHDPYGLCMYRSARDGGTYVFVNGDDTAMKQWRLVDAGNGRVRAEPVRELTFDSQTEGCVADDDAGALYVGEEDVALWRLGAEPDDGDTRSAVDRIEDNPALVADIEGMGLYDLGEGRGYLVASVQGSDTYAVYRREAPQEYLGSFAVAADPGRGIDGISETDGLDVDSRNLGPGFEHGAMVAQDGRNLMPAENQNFKYVPWQAIAEALGLEMRGQ